jgi:hypothetical protein
MDSNSSESKKQLEKIIEENKLMLPVPILLSQVFIGTIELGGKIQAVFEPLAYQDGSSQFPLPLYKPVSRMVTDKTVKK